MKQRPKGAIRRGRLVAGIAIHFVAPAYVLTLVADAALGHAPPNWADWLSHALALGGPFLLAYGGAAIVLTGLAAWSDGKPAAPQEDAISQSRQALAASLAQARGRLGGAVDALLDRAAGLAPDHSDSQTREIVRDINRLLDASLLALDAAPAQQAQLCDRTGAALAKLVEALERKSRETTLLAQDKAHTLANYIDSKYG